MWDKLLKFPAHPPYKPIRSTHGQRSETGASKRTKISCGSRRGRQGSSRVVRGRQGSSGVVRGRQGSSGVVRGRQGSSGVVRGRQGSSGVVRGRQESSGVVRGRQGSSGVVRGRQGSSGVAGVVSDRGRQSRQESSGVVRSRQESSGVVRSRQESSGVVSWNWTTVVAISDSEDPILEIWVYDQPAVVAASQTTRLPEGVTYPTTFANFTHIDKEIVATCQTYIYPSIYLYIYIYMAL